MIGENKCYNLTIRSRLIFLIGLMSLVGLAVGIVGLVKTERRARVRPDLTNRVVSIGYIKNIESATQTDHRRANRYRTGS